MKRFRRTFLTLTALLAVPPVVAPAGEDFSLPRPRKADAGSDREPKRLPAPKADSQADKELEEKVNSQLPPDPPSILTGKLTPIDLPSALKLAGVDNPEILLARQRVVEGAALRQLAAAQILPNLNVGVNYDGHQGNLQQSNGNILSVNRNSLYLGLGANAVGSGTVNIPGITYNLNLSRALFGGLIARQEVAVREFESVAVYNETLLRVATSYVELLRAEGHRVIAQKNRDEARKIARLNVAYAITGAGKQSDADRALNELSRRNDEILQAEGDLLVASAALARLLSLSPGTRLYAVDGWVVPAPIVPEPIPLEQLILISINQRPELAARRAAIREATLALRDAKVLPFSPNVILGFSAGTFGGGSNLLSRDGGFNGTPNQARFDNFAPRDDVDAVFYWTAQNCGVGNLALIRIARSNQQRTKLELLLTLNRVQTEVATAYARTHARFSQIAIGEQAVKTGERGLKEDLSRIELGQGLPIELLDSFRLLSDARFRYLDAITEYNRAHFELYVALGRPPADVLARPVPPDLVPPPALTPATQTLPASK